MRLQEYKHYPPFRCPMCELAIDAVVPSGKRKEAVYGCPWCGYRSERLMDFANNRFNKESGAY